MAFYGVAGGPNPGVYEDWPAAQRASKGQAGASVKKFKTKEEATKFAGGGDNNGTKLNAETLMAGLVT